MKIGKLLFRTKVQLSFNSLLNNRVLCYQFDDETKIFVWPLKNSLWVFVLNGLTRSEATL